MLKDEWGFEGVVVTEQTVCANYMDAIDNQQTPSYLGSRKVSTTGNCGADSTCPA